MKLTDLRDELNARAETTDQTPDLLPGVRRKITQTKRRRTAGAAGAVGGLAVIAAFAFGILPSLTTSTPQPADDVPHDYTRAGMTLPAFQGADRLEKGWIGDVGQNTLDFTWTPDGQDTRFATFCGPDANGTRFLTIQVNDYVVGTSACVSDPAADGPGNGIGVLATSALWLAAPAGKPAHVIVQLTDESGRQVRSDEAQVALGIYRTAVQPPDGPPTQAPPTSADDYVKDGVRYRAKIGGDTLIKAKIGDRGDTALAFTFTNPGGPLSFNDFCTATSPGSDPRYLLSIKINGEEVSNGGCSGDSIDAGLGSSFSPGGGLQTGQEVDVQVQLQDKNGHRVKASDAWIGLGIYAKGKQRIIDGTSLDEVREYGGHNYRLRDVSHAPLASTKSLTARTPPDTPYLISYGSTGGADEKLTVSVTSRSHPSASAGGGIGTFGEAAGPVSEATVTVTGSGAGKSTGELVLAIYVPAD